MASYQPVAFTSPGYDYGSDISQIERRRKMAEMLQQQGLQPMEQAPVAPGQFATPISPWQGAAKLATIFAAQRQGKKADEQQKSLAERSRADLASLLMNAQKAAAGTPGTPLSEDASGNVTPAQPAVPGDPSKAASLYMQHPQTAPLGMQMMQGQQQQQMMAAAIEKAMAGAQPQGAAPAAAGGTAPSYGTPGFQPQAQGPQPQGQTRTVPPGVDPLAWNLAIAKGDLGELAKLAQGAHTEANKPVVNRGFGIGRMVNGQYVPDAASQQQALDLERGKRDITAPLETPVTLKTTSGQEIQLSRPEYAEFQKSGQLPQRLGGQQQGAQQSQAVGFRVPGAPGLGTIGVTETDEDRIRKAGLQASNTEAGKEFISEMRQNYAKLRDVPATIENINRAKGLAGSQAAEFMGPLGESKLALQKFFRSNVPGQGNLNLEGVTKAEELQSTLFNQVMDNLKKMDASPSQYQQQVMQEAFGTLRTDPASVPRIMDVFEDILRNRVAIHNETVGSAEKRGTQFPHDVRVNLKDKVRSFGSLQEAEAAGLKPGAKVIINGVPGTLR